MTKSKVFNARALCLACALACCMLALSACGGSSQASSPARVAHGDYLLVKEGTLTVATSSESYPFAFQEGGELKGYDIALVKEIGKRLDLSVDIQGQPFGTLVAQVAAGEKYDCAISAIAITDERAQQVAFTDPYHDAGLAVVVLADSGIASAGDLAKLSVGAQSGSAGEKWVAANLAGAAYTPFKETGDMLDALVDGKLQAVVCDQAAAAHDIADEYDECVILELMPTGERYGVAVCSDNPGLVDAMNAVLAEMQADGTIAKLQAQWFGKDAE